VRGTLSQNHHHHHDGDDQRHPYSGPEHVGTRSQKIIRRYQRPSGSLTTRLSLLRPAFAVRGREILPSANRASCPSGVTRKNVSFTARREPPLAHAVFKCRITIGPVRVQRFQTLSTRPVGKRLESFAYHPPRPTALPPNHWASKPELAESLRFRRARNDIRLWAIALSGFTAR
jgi:hypothetical protein